MSTVEMGMAHGCGICHEVMGKATSEKNNPFLVTKCGHLFHFECLNEWFSRSGDNVAWGPKTCPSCKISLIIGTDIIRIFPTIISEIRAGTDIDSKKAVDELKTKLDQFTKQIMELSNRLEVSFLKIRESEQMVAKYRNETEVLRAKLRVEVNENNDNRSYIDWLNTQAHHLKNTITSLTHSLMECQQRLQFQSHPFPPFATRPMGPNFSPICNQQGPRRNFPPPVFPPFVGNSNPGILGPGYLYSNGRSRFPTLNSNTVRGPLLDARDETIRNGKMDEDLPSSVIEDSLFLSNKFSETVSLNPVEQGNDANETESLKIMKKSEDVKKENSGSMMSDPTDNETGGNTNEMVNGSEKDVNGNRVENGISGIGKQSYWKYHCEKCSLSWENRGGQDAQISFCHGCRKVVSPHSQVPIDN